MRDTGATMDIEVSKPNYFLRKRHFEYKNKAHDYEDATWEWIVKRGYEPRDQDPDYHRHIVLDPIRVVVWDEHHKPVNPDLTLEFPPDKSGLKEARSYSRQILEAGAIMASIDFYVSFPWQSRVLAESQTYMNATALKQLHPED